MKINEIVIDVMANTAAPDGRKITQVSVMERVNEKYNQRVTPAALSDRLKNENMRVNTALEMLDVMGYEIVVRPKKDGRREYIVERGGARVR